MTAPTSSPAPRPAGSGSPAPSSAGPPRPAAPSSAAPPSLARTAGTLVLDIGAPIALYYSLHAAGISNLVTLRASAVVPAIGVVARLASRRRLDGVGGLVVATVVAAVVAHHPAARGSCWPRMA